MSRTRRCIDCPLKVEVEEDELCPSCGRCRLHCTEIGHEHMSTRTDAEIAAHNR